MFWEVFEFIRFSGPEKIFLAHELKVENGTVTSILTNVFF